MGTYINPDNWGFRRIRKSEYVDKSGLIGLVNSVIDTSDNLICVSRPRRFGKSYAAQMLAAYYSLGSSSHSLFSDLAIASESSYSTHLNAYNVIRLDMTDILQQGEDVVAVTTELLQAELHEEFPDVRTTEVLTLSLLAAVRASGRKFVFIIDEWDAPVRECGETVSRRYIEFLRSLFKNASFTAEAVAVAYITGILPIKRYNTQSAMSEFNEFTMLAPGEYAPYVGFTEVEVRSLCKAHDMDFDEARRWYDGYELDGLDRRWRIYSPFSVMRAMARRRFASYWTSTAAYDSLLGYIERDFDGLQNSVARLVAGESLPVDSSLFQNDMREVHSSDDVLTVLAHLGYLAFDEESQAVRIPNEEVRQEFARALRAGKRPQIEQMVAAADQLLKDTIEGNEQAVAAAIQRAHDSRLGPDWYNDEQALRFTVKLAYLTAIDSYAEIEELPSGHGRADIVYLPKRYSSLPAMVVELKWDKEPESALAQIRQRNYPAVLCDYGGPVILVGLTYNAASKEHVCKIERLQ